MNVLLLADTRLSDGQAARLVDKLGGHLESAGGRATRLRRSLPDPPDKRRTSGAAG